LKLGKFWTAIRWKILTIYSLFGVGSVITVACFSIAVVNVLLRRESAYLIEERIKVIVESRKSLMDPILDKIQGCQYSTDSTLVSEFTEHLNATWPGSQTIVTILSLGALHNADPLWFDTGSFAGVVEDLCERWRVHYNTIRPHSSLGYRPPAPEAWQISRNMGHGEVESKARFPLLHTPDDCDGITTQAVALH
jgi:hypothetical protein